MTVWISYKYTYIPSLLTLPPHHHPTQLGSEHQDEFPVTLLFKCHFGVGNDNPLQCFCLGNPIDSCRHQLKFNTRSSVQFSHSVMSNSLQPHELQHARPPCPSPTPEFTQIHVHWVGDATQPSHPLLSPSPPTLNLSQHQGLFKWVSPSHQVAKVLEFQGSFTVGVRKENFE